MTIDRRTFLTRTAQLGLVSGLPLTSGCSDQGFPFIHGVASGDPLADRVILWTRISPNPNDLPDFDSEPARIDFEWRIATDSRLRNVVSRGKGTTGPDRDYTAKIDAADLSPDTTYYYSFTALGYSSETGRTKTLPEGQTDQVRLAVCSCANYPYGYFNVYHAIAQRSDIDAVLHLGDYIYEYANKEYGDGSRFNRVPSPDREIVSLQDYRQRYAQYRSDPDLAEVHRQHPFICVWDDHETTDNSWRDGANNHQPDTEGAWQTRKNIGIQAYMEWMPIREQQAEQGLIYRHFRFGDLVDLMMLDTRLYGRDQQVAANSPARNDPARSLLGQQQEDWLYQQLIASQNDGTRWRMLGQQVMMAQLGTNQVAFNMDQWDGYPASRKRLYDTLETSAIDNLVVLTGDIHSSWANELARNPYNFGAYNPITGQGALGVEFVTPAVTSPGIEDPKLAKLAGDSVRNLMPHIKFVDWYYRGYLLLDITHERTQAEWYKVSTVESQRYTESFMRGLKTNSGESRLRSVTTASAEKVAAAAPSPTYRSLLNRFV